MASPELPELFALFVPEDWVAFRAGLADLSLRYFGLRCPAAFELFWMEIEMLVRELASQRLASRGAELIALAVAS